MADLIIGGGASTLQDAYDNSVGGATPEIVVDSTRGALQIRDNATPIAADLFRVENNAGGNLFAVARDADGGAEIGVDLLPDTDFSREIGSPTLRFDDVVSKHGDFVGGTRSVTFNGTGATGGPVAIVAGNQYGGPGTESITVDHNSSVFTPLIVAGNTYTYAGGETATITADSAGGGMVIGSAFTYGGPSATITGTNFGNFTGGYAYSPGGSTAITNNASGAFLWAYPRATAGTATAQAQTAAAGAFVQGRMQQYGAGTSFIRARAAGQFVQGYTQQNSSGAASCAIQGGTGQAQGQFVQGTAFSTSTGQAIVEGATGARGAFAQGVAVNNAANIARIRVTADGGFAQGYARAFTAAADIEASGAGAFAHGYAQSADITASGPGSFAVGTSASGPITASNSNAFQFGPGVNATADSLQVGGNGTDVGFRALGQGNHASPNDAFTLGAAATTFAATSNVMTITGDAGTNTIATITGGLDGQYLILVFVDALVTITDDNTATANTVNLNSPFTSAADVTLTLVFDGTSWYEVSRSTASTSIAAFSATEETADRTANSTESAFTQMAALAMPVAADGSKEFKFAHTISTDSPSGSLNLIIRYRLGPLGTTSDPIVATFIELCELVGIGEEMHNGFFVATPSLNDLLTVTHQTSAGTVVMFARGGAGGASGQGSMVTIEEKS